MSDFETVPVGTMEELKRVKEERDELTTNVVRLMGALELARDRIALLAEIATDRGAAVYAALDMWPGEMEQTLAETPYTSLAHRDSVMRRDEVEFLLSVIGAYPDRAAVLGILRERSEELRQQAEGGEYE